jgi:6-pyruvoyltetrahydropterin/6-carboxytetrahydropterin synthase
MFGFNKKTKEKKVVEAINFPKGTFFSTKTYGNDRGLSCCFRQWKATHSHCSLLHGYSLGFKLVFECDSLDERNWVQDFGGLKELKNWLEATFDHTIVVAKDDPQLSSIKELGKKGLGKVVVLDQVGSEKFAEEAFKQMTIILEKHKYFKTSRNPPVRVRSVECFEHGANSAGFER